MAECCPPGEGCNAVGGGEPCALAVLRRDERPEARRALSLWESYEHETGSRQARRFLRRAYARARERALGPWTPWGRSRLSRIA